MWKFNHTMLTSEVMNEAERMYQDITITAEQRQQIERAAYVACMNKDTTAARLADFRRVLKNHHVSPEDIAPAADAEQQPTETENAPQAATQAAQGTDEKKKAETMSSNAPFTPAEAAMHATTARGIIRRKGGYRERDIINHPHTVERGTWTTEHKVIEILSTTPDPDGYRPGCAVDIVTRSIVG